MSRTIFYRRPVQVKIEPNIGLDTNARQSVIDILNVILADETLLFQKSQHAGGGEKDGANGAELHLLYDIQCKQMHTITSDITERIQILGGLPLHGSENFMDTARLGKDTGSIPGVVSILADHEAFIRFLREDARKCSEMYDDQGTYTLLIDVMRTHEKIAWVLRAKIASE